MMNMLQTGLEWLSRKQKQFVSSQVIYCRDDIRYSVDAVLGRTKFETADENGFTITSHTIDFLIQDASVLTTLTKTPIDDIIAAAAIRVVDNNNSWTAVYALAQLVRDGVGYEGALIPQSAGNNISVESIAREACPECPATGLAALGILLYLLQQRR